MTRKITWNWGDTTWSLWIKQAERWQGIGPGFPGGSVVKNPPAMQEPQETCVQSLGQEGPLDKAMATHSSILLWRIPWREEPGGLQSIGLQSAALFIIARTWKQPRCPSADE